MTFVLELARKVLEVEPAVLTTQRFHTNRYIKYFPVVGVTQRRCYPPCKRQAMSSNPSETRKFSLIFYSFLLIFLCSYRKAALTFPMCVCVKDGAY